MQKKIKIIFSIIFVCTLFLIFWLIFLLFLFGKDVNNQKIDLLKNDSKNNFNNVIEVIDPSVMTLDERVLFNLSPLVRAEVWARNASGTIQVYKVLSEDAFLDKISKIQENKKYDKNNFGETIEILNNEDEHKLGLFHLGVYEVIARNENGGISAYRYLRTDNEKDIPLEWLSDDEKNELGLNPELRIQILQRGESGKILAYKIIKDDNGILTSY